MQERLRGHPGRQIDLAIAVSGQPLHLLDGHRVAPARSDLMEGRQIPGNGGTGSACGNTRIMPAEAGVSLADVIEEIPFTIDVPPAFVTVAKARPAGCEPVNPQVARNPIRASPPAPSDQLTEVRFGVDVRSGSVPYPTSTGSSPQHRTSSTWRCWSRESAV